MSNRFLVIAFAILLGALVVAMHTLEIDPLNINARTIRLITDRFTPEGRYQIGMMFLEGDGAGQNIDRALDWLKRAASQEHVQANFQIGFIYRKGLQVPRNAEEAIKWYVRAASLGSLEAMYNLGVMYETDPALKGEREQALVWYRKGAELGHVKSQGMLGTHLTGSYLLEKIKEKSDTRPDPAEAYMWLLLAEASGDEIGTANRKNLEPHLTEVQITQGKTMASEWAPKQP